MNKDTNVIFRINSTLKENVTNIAKNRGYTLSELITACLKDIEHRKMIPININRFLPNKMHYSLTTEITIAKIKHALETAINKNGKDLVKKGYLFGSYSRGEATSNSDIDIRLEAKRGLTLIEVGNIRQDLVDELGKEVDLLVIEAKKLEPAFYNNIRKDEICIYER